MPRALEENPWWDLMILRMVEKEKEGEAMNERTGRTMQEAEAKQYEASQWKARAEKAERELAEAREADAKNEAFWSQRVKDTERERDEWRATVEAVKELHWRWQGDGQTWADELEAALEGPDADSG